MQTTFAFPLGPERQRFVDDMLVEATTGLRRTVHQPRRHPDNPLITPTLAEEGERAALYGTVLYDPAESLFKAWYTANNPIGVAARYAVSEDGLHWRKPALDHAIEPGSNLVFTGNPGVPIPPDAITGCDGLSVMLDAGDGPRYKALWYSKYKAPDGGPTERPFPQGHYTAWSDDGIRWHSRATPVLDRTRDPLLGDANTCMWDPLKQRFIAFTKRTIHNPRTIGDSGTRCRSRSLSVSDDFEHWSDPALIFTPDDQDTPDIQHYNQNGWTDEGMYLGLLEIYYSHYRAPHRPLGKEFELVSSRDGEHWQRVDRRQLFMSIEDDDAWDGGMLNVNSHGPIPVGDELWFYYGGGSGRHDHHPELFPWPHPKRTCIGLATLRRDGYVSYDGGDDGGWLVTRPIRFEQGQRLFINAAVQSGGAIRAAVRSVHETERGEANANRGIMYRIGDALPGYTEAEAVPATGDATRLALRWQQTDQLPVTDGWYSLAFKLERASLYAFWAE